MSVQNHPWCHDVPRDVAIRRAEDEAAVPSLQHRDLPAAVEELRERVGRLENHFADGSKMAAPPQPAPVPPADVTPPREAAPVSREGVNADGLRTERVTLEITHRRHAAHEWAWPQMIWLEASRGESVRVVEEATEIDRLTAERDEARAECERMRSELAKAKAKDANAGGEKPEPVAWVATKAEDDGGYQRCLGWDRNMVIHGIDLTASSHPVSVSPLYAAPPEPRGWLTAKERGALSRAFDLLCDDDGDQPLAGTVQRLLARETPPRVVLKDFPPDTIRNVDSHYLAGWNQCMALAKKAIREAGGEVE